MTSPLVKTKQKRLTPSERQNPVIQVFPRRPRRIRQRRIVLDFWKCWEMICILKMTRRD